MRFAIAADPPAPAPASAKKQTTAKKKKVASKSTHKPAAKAPAHKTLAKASQGKPAQGKAAPASKSAPKSAPAKTATPAAKKTAVRRTPHYKPAPPVDPTEGDNVDGDDLVVRRAAVDALGTMNGAVVAVDPTNGRVLSIVNQKLALKSGFVPCSTIKLVTALAALNDGIINRDTTVRISRMSSFNLTTALAHSNNQFFQRLGNQLGYDRVSYYAHELGLGEKAGLNITGEEPGVWPAAPPSAGGVGMMTAYGENILMTPLELAALLSSIANGGKLFYLQYPKTIEEADWIRPQLKRTLDLADGNIEDVKLGMRGAVDFGTARRAGYTPDDPILGKTGTCTDFRESNHMGWFGSFNEVDHHQLVIVVMLLGTRSVSGPVASGVAGEIYRSLSAERYFMADSQTPSSGAGTLYTSHCCSQ
ncbi:MAG TPA: penicillin-binding transpeptidase domain-containing protein [Bryobacteraceae bacterium]|nr:penicillin-binding transpeptidase domain-containing protein [Bryobacteraceae bacterium]